VIEQIVSIFCCRNRRRDRRRRWGGNFICTSERRRHATADCPSGSPHRQTWPGRLGRPGVRAQVGGEAAAKGLAVSTRASSRRARRARRARRLAKLTESLLRGLLVIRVVEVADRRTRHPLELLDRLGGLMSVSEEPAEVEAMNDPVGICRDRMLEVALRAVPLRLT